MFLLEILSTVAGILCVGLLIYRNHWSWPIGFVQVVFQGAVFWESKLYAETGLQVVFAVLQIYGWWAWLACRNGWKSQQPMAEEIRVETLSRRGLLISIMATGLATWILAWFLIRFTDGKSPELDAFITAASLTAQYLLAARFRETWVYWIIVDVVSIPLYVARGLYPFVILYVLFLGLAIAGWLSWQRALRVQRERSSEVA